MLNINLSSNIVLLSCLQHNFCGTCLYGHLIKAVTSLIQPHPVGPKQPQCIYYGMQPGQDGYLPITYIYQPVSQAPWRLHQYKLACLQWPLQDSPHGNSTWLPDTTCGFVRPPANRACRHSQHLIVPDTALLQPTVAFATAQASLLLQATPPVFCILQPQIFGPMVTALDQFHCSAQICSIKWS